jgi:hypothetical protein
MKISSHHGLQFGITVKVDPAIANGSFELQNKACNALRQKYHLGNKGFERINARHPEGQYYWVADGPGFCNKDRSSLRPVGDDFHRLSGDSLQKYWKNADARIAECAATVTLDRHGKVKIIPHKTTANTSGGLGAIRKALRKFLPF